MFGKALKMFVRLLKICKISFKVLIIAVLIVAASVIGLNIYVKACSSGKIVSKKELEEKDFDCIVVLGAGVKADGSPSLMLKERLDLGIELYKNGVSKKLLLSGDHRSQYYDEVNTMRNYCLANGVESKDIFMDHAGLSTYDSIFRAKNIFGAEKIVVVTQKYHLYRAVYIAKKAGLDIKGIACDTRTYSGQTYRTLREIIARDKDVFKCIKMPNATVMGDKIPISGNGEVTTDETALNEK